MHHFNSLIQNARNAPNPGEPVLAGNSVAALALRQMVMLAAQSAEPVQLTGPEGSGFLELAEAIHRQSELADEPFVHADCDSMSDDHFCIRWRGTLFIGDAGRLMLPVQKALLDWMDSADGEYVHVISAVTDRTRPAHILPELQQRLGTTIIPCAPLVQRKRDIPIMLQRIWAESSHPLPPIFERGAWSQMVAHDWPGNFGELSSFAEKAARLYGGRRVEADDVRRLLGSHATRELERPDFNLKQHLAREEKMFMIEALLKSQGVVQDAAQLAGLNRTTFIAKMKRHGLARA